MSDQMTFVEPLKRRRRKMTAPDKIAATIGRLADWYAVNKPGLKSMTISTDDFYSLKTLWSKKEKGVSGEMECRASGFSFDKDGNLSWRGFDLIEGKS